jgi:hypothetical protein
MVFQSLRRALAPSLLVGIGVALGFVLLEIWLLVLYAIDCGSSRERLLTVTTFGLAGLLAFMTFRNLAWAAAGEAYERTVASQHLSKIGLALHLYQDQYRSLPPAAATGSIERRDSPGPAVSWRVLILPQLEHSDLYNLYRMDEPWDSPHNRQLLPRMPREYRLTNRSSMPEERTYFRVFVSAPNVQPRAAFENESGVPLNKGSFPDGLDQTILVVEAAEAVPWTKPDELLYDPNKPVPPLGGYFNDSFLVVFASGFEYPLPRRIKEQTLRALITRNGGERINRND